MPWISAALVAIVLAQAAPPPGDPLAQSIAAAQVAHKSAPVEHKFLVMIDAAHGGKDDGALLSSGTASRAQEKDTTLAVARTLHSALAARGIESRLTRDEDKAVSTQERAALAAQVSPSACIALHATAAGSGVHVLYPLLGFVAATRTPIDSWSAENATPGRASLQLARLVQREFANVQVPVVLEPAANPLLAHAHCAAIAVEMAPLRTSYAATQTAADSAYQQHVADLLASALDHWRAQQAALNATAASYGRKAGHE
jgi:N-acetylmuramoyl-L-alanine amidase